MQLVADAKEREALCKNSKGSKLRIEGRRRQVQAQVDALVRKQELRNNNL